MPTIHTPDWVKDAVFYQIFPDRFAIGSDTTVHKPGNLEAWDAPPTTSGFKGGDLYGVIDRLPYLHELGVTALYLNPIFQSTANHRYHTQDYYRVDPLLGGDAAFDLLLSRAEEYGMRVVLDGVFNHTGRGFYQIQHTLENGSASPYLDWFDFNPEFLAPGSGPHAYPSGTRMRRARRVGSREAYGYSAWWDLPALPKLNTATPTVRRFIFDVAQYWIRRGAAGWRLDVPTEIDDDEFWREFRRVVKEANPDAYIVGEIWTDAERWLRGDQFDAVMNYVVTRAAIGFFGRAKLNKDLCKAVGHGVRKLSTTQFAAEMDRVMRLYDEEVVQTQLNLLGSHDMPRLLSLLGRDRGAVWLAFTFLFTIPGAPCIYYGDELGMAGGADPDCRRSFPAQTNLQDSEESDRELQSHIRTLAHLRHKHRCLRRGAFQRLQAQNTTGLYAYARLLAAEAAVVVLNTGEEPCRLNLRAPSATGGRRVPWNSVETHLLDDEAELRRSRLTGATIPPRGAAILILRVVP